jgi:hypothetical protein
MFHYVWFRLNYQCNLPSINTPHFDDILFSQKYFPIISSSLEANSNDTETFIAEVGFRDESECRSVLEPSANRNRCSFTQQFGFQEMRITMPQPFPAGNHQQYASSIQHSIAVDGQSLHLQVNNGEIRVLLDAIERQVVRENFFAFNSIFHSSRKTKREMSIFP